ncbi:PD-(D/E)XK nuclease superfamily protein [Candidatus Xiphinematobacter sp. Idaho Grape]|uniref:PD-(D/E)XK nuclease family protein n=1 Tax=Candidatus Xiphinematobacter sp. Idaho Grape TaxID=1704307 RepID=UPI0007063A30|nr:PD-(D/E)XK nuclease family protein [Candidatus Xiphinematobacter sp. Idaho Grape]ALJ56206.1 PD-(D/E)XK nuclease superfamily protein [Candidatus Xiphinematobacter sp. Idaho Grape]
MSRKLCLYTDWETGFTHATRWVEQAAQQSFLDERQTAVIFPNSVVANQLRKVLASRGTTFMNVHFWTPTAFRKRMLHGLSGLLSIASYKELHLIASSVAADWVSDKWSRSTETDLNILLRVLGLLNNFELVHAQVPKELRNIADLAKNFHKVLREQGLQTVSEADCCLVSHKWQKKFVSLLVFGFHGGYWSLFPLLSLAHQTTEKLEVVLENPSETSFNLDRSWIESWERLMDVKATLLGGLEWKKRSFDHVEFLTEPTTYNLAWAIALRASKMVVEGAKTVAVVFSAYGPLSREVALALNRLRLPYFDGIGHTCLYSPEKNHWREWCIFQEAPTAQSLSEFLALLPDQVQTIDLLREASRETLSQDIHVCTRFASLHGDREKDWRKLSSFSLLPERSSLDEFCKKTTGEFIRLGWTKEADCLLACQTRLQRPDRLLLKRDAFLCWLQKALREKYQLQDPMGSHPYATIQLVLRDQAALCPWTHVILAGMNAGQWPDSGEQNSSLTPVILNLCQSIATTDIKFPGNSPFNMGKNPSALGHCIPSLFQKEQTVTQRRDFQSLCKAPNLVATAQMRNNDVTDCPSVWFSELYERYGKTGEGFRTHFPSSQPYVPFIAATSPDKLVWKARTDRLDPTIPFGRWEFVAPPPSSPLEITVADAERIWKEPAIAWMKIFLGVGPAEMPESSTTRVGTWVHRWLRNLCVSAADWARLPDKSSRREIILAASEGTRTAVEKSYRAIQRQLPSYWTLTWKQAQSFAVECSNHLETFRPRFPYISTEHSFRNVRVGPFIIHGRWDLLLSTRLPESDPAPYPFVNTSMVVVDYKTGKRSLNATSPLFNGRDTRIKMQLSLYTQAALANGALQVDAACIAPHCNAGQNCIQLSSKELEEIQPLLLSIGRILREGVFGMRGKLYRGFTSYNKMPLATLPITQDILESKWELTQKNLLAMG